MRWATWCAMGFSLSVLSAGCNGGGNAQGGGGGGGGSSGSKTSGATTSGWTRVVAIADVFGLGVADAITVDGDTVIVGTDTGMVLSGDDGATWTKKNAGLPMMQPTRALIALSDRVLAGFDQGVYTSMDHGNTWTETDMGLPRSVSVYAFFDTGDSILVGMNAGSADPGVEGGVFRSTDKGATWHKASTGLMQVTGASSFAKLGSTVFACAQGTVAKSTDDGQSWQPQPIPDGNALSIVNLDGTLLVSSSSSTIYSSSDGASWTAVGKGLPAKDPSDMLFLADKTLYATAFASDDNGVFVSRDAGQSFQAFNQGLNVLGVPTAPGVVGLAQHKSSLFALSDIAEVWKRGI